MPFAIFLALAIAQGKIDPVPSALAVLNIIWYAVFLFEWYVYKFPKDRRWVRSIAGMLSLIIMVAAVVWQSRLTAPAPFLSRVRGAPVGAYEKTRGGVFWVTYNRGEGEIVTPAQLGLYIEIINQQAREATIDSYIVEAQNRSNKWFRLIRLDASDSPVFLCITDFHQAKPLDLSNGLDRQLKDKPMSAYGTVRGWAFFELPQDIRENSPFRLTVEDNTGIAAQTVENEDSASPIKDYVQSADLHLATGIKDLSASRFMMYSELFRERVPE